MSQPMRLMINGEVRTLEAPEDMPLLWVLRDMLGLTGTKFGCGSWRRNVGESYTPRNHRARTGLPAVSRRKRRVSHFFRLSSFLATGAWTMGPHLSIDIS